MKKYLLIALYMLGTASAMSEELKNDFNSVEEVFLRTNQSSSFPTTPVSTPDYVHPSHYNVILPQPLPSLVKPVILGLLGILVSCSSINVILLNFSSERQQKFKAAAGQQILESQYTAGRILNGFGNQPISKAEINTVLMNQFHKQNMTEVKICLGEEALKSAISKPRIIILGLVSTALIGYSAHKIYQYIKIKKQNAQIRAKSHQELVPSVGQASA